MAKMTRRRMKEDKLLSTTAKLSIFLNKNWRQIAGVIAAVVILIATISLYVGYVARKNERSALKMIGAMTLFAEGEFAPDSSDSDEETESAAEKYEKAKVKFQEIIQSGGRSQIISEALFYSAKSSYRLGEYGEAISGYEKIISKYPKSILAFNARIAIGNCYEQLGEDENLRKAIQQYNELSRSPESYITLRAFIDAGRCYEKLMKWDEAVESYSNIVDKFNTAVEAAIQSKCKGLVQKARETIAKYKLALGENQLNADFTKFESEASTYEGNQQWFEALRMYDKAIFSQKEAWGAENVSGEAGQEALDTLQNYEDMSANVIKYLGAARRSEKQGKRDDALRFYRRAVTFDFLPGTELYEEAQLRIDWINSVERNRIRVSDQQR